MKVVTAQEMRDTERLGVAEGVSTDALMEAAGLAVAQEVAALLVEVHRVPVLVLVGPGNNGGDGLVAARHLQRWGAQVILYLCASRPARDPKLEAAQVAGCTTVEGDRDLRREALEQHLGSCRLVLDAVLGTGRARPLSGLLGDVMERLQRACQGPRRPLVVALDMPTGLDADGGPVDPLCPVADLTVTLGYPKTGLFTPQGARHAGRWKVVDIGIPPHLGEALSTDLLTPDFVASRLPPRPPDAHKGTFGRVLVVAGSRSYVGAAYLACMGAYRAGAGLVTLAAPESLYPLLAQKLTEATHLPLPESAPGVVAPAAARLLRDRLREYQVAVIGCGLSQEPSVLEFIQRLLLSREIPIPTVLDADALNHLTQITQWWEHLEGPAIVTPHPGEMARLLDRQADEIQANRLAIAREAASRWRVTVVLKGAFTVVASPSGATALSPFANPGLATAGTGDVLAGVIGGLVAQGLQPFEAACCGVYLHGAAGEEVRRELGDTGMIASDLLPLLPKVIQRLRAVGTPAGA